MAQQSTQGAMAKRPNNYFDGLAVGGYHKLIFFIIMLAYFFEQMDNWNFGFIAPAVFKSWGISGEASHKAMATVTMWYFIGMTSGGFLGGIISDIIGRRKTFLISIVLFSVCSVINGLPIESFPVFVAARTMTGFGVFCLMVCSQAYIAEMAPSESRGKWQGLVAAVGFCAVPVIAFLCRLIVPLSPEAWRYIFYFGGTGLIALFFAVKYLQESPRWLVAQGRVAEAEEVVQKITGLAIDLSQAAKNIPVKTNAFENIINMFNKKYISRTMVLLITFTLVNPAGFMFTNWTGKFLSAIYSQEDMLTIMTIISCGVPAGCYVASLIADKGGRKIPIMCMYSLAGLCCYLFGIFYETFAFVALCGFVLSVGNMSAGFMLFSYTAESYPTNMRNTATGVHNALARLSVAASNPVIPILLAAFGGVMNGVNYDIPVVFTTAALLFLIPIPFIALFGARTGGRSLEDIS